MFMNGVDRQNKLNLNGIINICLFINTSMSYYLFFVTCVEAFIAYYVAQLSVMDLKD